MNPNDARSRPSGNTSLNRPKSTGEFQLHNSNVVVQQSPAGYVARIEHNDSIRPNPEYAGPLPETTIDALREVRANV